MSDTFISWLWVALAVLGISVHLVCLKDGLGDFAALRGSHGWPPHRRSGTIIARARMRSVVLRLFMFSSFLLVGVAALLKSPAFPALFTWSQLAISAGNIVAGVLDTRSRLAVTMKIQSEQAEGEAVS